MSKLGLLSHFHSTAPKPHEVPHGSANAPKTEKGQEALKTKTQPERDAVETQTKATREQQEKLEQSKNKLDITHAREKENITRQEHRDAETKAETKKQEKEEAEKALATKEQELTNKLTAEQRTALDKEIQTLKNNAETKRIEHTKADTHANSLKSNHEGAALDRKVAEARSEVYDASIKARGLDTQVRNVDAEINKLGSLAADKKSLIKNDPNMSQADKDRYTKDIESYKADIEKKKTEKSELEASRDQSLNQAEAKQRKFDELEAKQSPPKDDNRTPAEVLYGRPAGADNVGANVKAENEKAWIRYNDWKGDTAVADRVKAGLKDNPSNFVTIDGKRYEAKGYKGNGNVAEKADGEHIARNQTKYMIGAGVLLVGGSGYAYYDHSKSKEEEAAQAGAV